MSIKIIPFGNIHIEQKKQQKREVDNIKSDNKVYTAPVKTNFGEFNIHIQKKGNFYTAPTNTVS